MSKTKERVLTEPQQKFLDALFLPEIGGDYRKAMRHAGYSDNTMVSEVISSLSEEILDRANKIILMNAPKAAYKLTDQLDNPNEAGATLVNKTALEILDRAGISKKAEKTSQEIKAPGGVVILPAKGAVKVEIFSEEEDDSE